MTAHGVQAFTGSVITPDRNGIAAGIDPRQGDAIIADATANARAGLRRLANDPASAIEAVSPLSIANAVRDGRSGKNVDVLIEGP